VSVDPPPPYSTTACEQSNCDLLLLCNLFRDTTGLFSTVKFKFVLIKKLRFIM